MGSEEKKFKHGNHEVLYKTQDAKDDRRHMVVVFVGIKPIDEYDFDGPVAVNCKAGFLWIKDVFRGQNSYYMSVDMDLSVSDAVNELISTEMNRRGLSKENVTLLGFSKGASAALYYSLKYDYPNVVITVPQINVGSFTRYVFPKIHENMTIEQSDEERLALDALLPDLLASDKNRAKNIYLFTSLADDQFVSHIKPVLPDFAKYENFNFILTDSERVDRHGAVTYYNVPMILSLIYSLTENIVPRLGLVENGGRASKTANELEELLVPSNAQ